MILADMHVHSHFSDGADSPREVVKKAKLAGLTAVCLADHDTSWGIPEFLDALQEFEMLGIPAVEITTQYNGTVIHILGYGMNLYQTEIMENSVNLNWRVHNSRIEKALESYRQAGIMNVSLAELKEKTGYQGPCAMKLWLRDYRMRFHGLTHDQAVAETRKNGIAYFNYDKHELLTTIDAVKLIKALGGLSVFAHPGAVIKKIGEDEFFNIFYRLRKFGLNGLEAFHTSNTLDQTSLLLWLAGKSKLFITGGSDFHGRFHPERQLGKFGVSMTHFTKMQNRLHA